MVQVLYSVAIEAARFRRSLYGGNGDVWVFVVRGKA